MNFWEWLKFSYGTQAIELNIQGAWVGEKTPMFVTRLEDIE